MAHWAKLRLISGSVMSQHQIKHRTDIGWQDDNVHVQAMRQPFVRRVRRVLRVGKMPAFADLISEQRTRANIDTRSYYTYPLLFYTLFPELSLAQLRTLSLIGAYLFDYILSLDRLMDHRDTGDAGNVFVGSLLQQEALALLHALFPLNSPFWNHFREYFEHFIQSSLQERIRHHYLVNAYTREEMAFIYAGKPAVGKVCIAAMATLSARPELIPTLVNSHDTFYVGFQILDDLHDWRLDYHNHHYSYPLTLAFTEAGWTQRIESESRPEAAEVGCLLQRLAIPERLCALAIEYLDRAEGMLDKEMDKGSWAAAIQKTRQRIENFIFQLEPLPPTAATAKPTTLHWEEVLLATELPLPVSPTWLAWLDPERKPRPLPAAVSQTQAAHLRQLAGAADLGTAISQLGLAMHHSQQAHPQVEMLGHLGLLPAEWRWCCDNDAWLKAILSLTVTEPGQLWQSPVQAVPEEQPFSAWAPPAIGRYLGYRLVEDYQTHYNRPLADVTADDVLRYYHYQLIA